MHIVHPDPPGAAPDMSSGPDDPGPATASAPARAGAGPSRALVWMLLAGLALYSIWLMALELTTSQAGVRPYFSDIEGSVALFGVNTTLSASLLGGAALLLAFAALSSDRAGRSFLLSQAAIFGLLAADDRFQLHERIGWRLGIGDHYVLLAWAVAELAFLAAFCRPALLTLKAALLFVAGASLFAIMFAVDAFVPAAAPMRLSIEDLAKSWAAAMFFGFAWETARDHLSTRAR